MTGISCLGLKLHRSNGEWVDYGIVGYRLVTTAFVTALATALHTQASAGNLFYHALGIGVAAADIGDTGMGTELTTEYTEHGVMGAASGASTLIDRHTFAAVNMISGDSLVSTYQITFTAGG
jgi:hypothetical protein